MTKIEPLTLRERARLIDARLAAGISEVQACRLCGISRPTYRRAENGDRLRPVVAFRVRRWLRSIEAEVAELERRAEIEGREQLATV